MRTETSVMFSSGENLRMDGDPSAVSPCSSSFAVSAGVGACVGALVGLGVGSGVGAFAGLGVVSGVGALVGEGISCMHKDGASDTAEHVDVLST